MQPCVIAYFPGSGGNRLARYILNKNWSAVPDTHYHNVRIPVPEVNYFDNNTRPYPYADSVLPQRLDFAIELTHCLSTELLKKHFPNRRIIKIKSHFVPSYSRCWNIWTKDFHTDEIAKFGQKHAMNICAKFHWDYYTTTGVDWQADEIYDIDNGHNEFCKFMRENFAQHYDSYINRYQIKWQLEHQRNLDFGY